MASESSSTSTITSMSKAELLAYTQKELDADAERHAKAAAASNGEVPSESPAGATIDLSKKGIEELPIEIIQMISERVERLALSHNPQIKIPSEIVQCDRLRYLNVRVNHLTEFPETVLGLTKLEILDLSKNDITVIPEEIKRMTSLKFLAIVRNQIKRLPLALGEMPNLHKLKFEDNPIEFPTQEELQIPEDKSIGNGTAEIDRDREICQQVKRVMKNKTLRQRLMRPSTEDEASESNVETPRPPRRLNGRFPVRPSISGIEGLDLIRSASNSPPDAGALTKIVTKRSPPRNGETQPTSAPLHNGTDLTRSSSQTGSTSASLRARRQGFVPDKRKNTLGSVSEITTQSSRSSNASTIKPAHTYKVSTSSTLSGIGSSSGAESSGGSPVVATSSAKRLSGMRRQLSHLIPPADVQKGRATQAARRLRTSLAQLHEPLQQVAVDIFKGVSKRSTMERQIVHLNTVTSELDKLLVQTDGKSEKEHDLSPQIIKTVQAALTSYSAVMTAIKAQLAKVAGGLEPMHMRSLMFQLYAATVEARNVVVFMGVPTKVLDSAEVRDTPRASRASQTWSSRTVTPTDAKSAIMNKRLRGATILRNQTSSASLKLIPPTRPETRSTSFLNAASPASERAQPPNTQSSDEIDDSNEQFERIYNKLETACDITSRSLPQCAKELKAQVDVAERDGQRNSRPWAFALKSCGKMLAANDQLASRLAKREPHSKDFWQLCDNFVQSWTDFATTIKEIGSARLDITNIRNLTKPVQRAVKDVSKTISDSSLYHQALKPARGRLAPPFPSGLNTALAREMSQSVSNPPSATPSSAQSATTISVPATPLTAALGPAAQATISTPGATSMSDYFSSITSQPNNTVRKIHDPIDTNVAAMTSPSAPQSAIHLASANSFSQNTIPYGRR